jgi:XTP/dITP diphosphohydrolase
MDLVVATGNAGKKREFEGMLRGTGVVLRTLDEFPDVPAIVENGRDFRENAIIKAKAAAKATGLWALGDDSGLCVDALGGGPGLQSARYADGPDEARRAKLLRELDGVPPERRGAAFVCAIALYGPEGQLLTFEGRCEGRIATAPRGRNGFGYDPLFEVAGDAAGRTMAELAEEEKAVVSHRGRAFAQARPQLVRLARGA